MNKEYFDNAINKAKSAFDVACQKTGEVVNTSKLSINVQTLKSKRNKLYATLGKQLYESVNDANELPEEFRANAESITEINQKIDELNLKISEIKDKSVCPDCGYPVNDDAAFCSRCGKQL